MSETPIKTVEAPNAPDDPGLEAEIVRAAHAWVDARRAYEASSRTVSRPGNYSELKGNIRRAERVLRAKVEALERRTEGQKGRTGEGEPQ